MKKKTITLTFLIALLALFATGCSDHERVNAATFIKYGEETKIIGSSVCYDLEGVKDDCAIIRYWTNITMSGKSKTIYYWIPLSELPASISSEIKAGRNPWTKESSGR
ncbi:MAG: hypothetical protein SFY80_15855 [Verrucomicrobiota bacterium]|nr:hypothetical protein [Verrucomicrobiota bacterium]